MSRKLASNEELTSIINKELNNIPDVEGVDISGVMLLKGIDENGCNWSTAITYNVGNGTKEYVDPYVAKIIGEASQQYNLEPRAIQHAELAGNIRQLMDDDDLVDCDFYKEWVKVDTFGRREEWRIEFDRDIPSGEQQTAILAIAERLKPCFLVGGSRP